MTGLYIPGYSDFHQAAGNVRASEQNDLRQRAGQIQLQGILQQQNAVAQKQRDLAEFEASLPPAERLKFRVDPAGYLKSVRPDPQGQAAMQLSGLLSTGGYQAPPGTPATDGAAGPADSVALSDQEALARLGVRVNPDGSMTQVSQAPPMAVNVPNPANVRALAVAAEPKQAISEILRQQRPQPQRPVQESPLARLMRERDSLPEGDPRRVAYDRHIEKLSTHQPPVNVYSQTLTPGVDAAGKPVFVQSSGRPDTPPKIVEGVSPPPQKGGEAGMSAESAGKVAMADQAILDIRGARSIIFDKDGSLNKETVAAINVPGTAGLPLHENARKAYSMLYNAMESKLRIETGAAATEREIRSILNRFLPKISDTTAVAKDKLDRLEAFMNTAIDQTKGVKKDMLKSRQSAPEGSPSIDDLLKKYGG